jgi:predicted MFS family arabinose efflux permease
LPATLGLLLARKAVSPPLADRAPIRVHRVTRRIGGRMFLAVLCVGAFFSLAPLDARQLGLSPPLLMAIYGATIFVARLGGTPLIKRADARTGLGAAISAVAIGSAVLGIAGARPLLIAGTAILGAGVAFTMPFAIKSVLHAIPPAETIASIGAMTAYFAAAQTAGAPLLGLCTRLGGLRAAFLAGAVTSAAALVLHLAGRADEHTRGRPAAPAEAVGAPIRKES